MATFDLGRVTPLYKGDYSASASYELNDVVLYNGNLYWHVQATATVGILPTDTTVWKLAFADEGVRAEIRGYADDAQASKTAAAQSASQASASASNASASASQAALSAQSAGTSEGNASTSASAAATSATNSAVSASQAASSAQTATDKATLASQKAASASESATLATAKANAAATSETNAAASAQTATAKASEAAASATSAQEYDESAQASAVNAQTAQGLAETAQTAAETAQGLAEDARDLAQQYAESIDPENIYSAYPTDTASGAVVSFADGADGIPLKSLVVDINPVQDLSQGDPSPENICPISGWTGMQIQHTGKNLVEGTIPNASITSGGGFVGSNDYEMHWGKIRKGVIYTVTTNDGSGFVGGFFTNVPVAGSVSYDGVRVITASKSFTAPITGYVAFRSATGYTTAQLEVGDTATPYEPYNGQTIPIDWQTEAGTVYGGSLDVLSGVLTVDRAMVDMGTLTWSYSTNYTRFSAPISGVKPTPSNYAVAKNLICSQYKPTFANKTADTSGNHMIAVGTGTSVFVRDESYTDAASFKSAMDGVQLVYELATPLTIQLTPHDVKSLLGQNNIFADTGDSSVEYRADTKMYIERLTEPDADMIADANIVSGSYFMVGNSLYLATANIASGSAVIEGTNATRKSLSEALNEINQ